MCQSRLQGHCFSDTQFPTCRFWTRDLFHDWLGIFWSGLDEELAVDQPMFHFEEILEFHFHLSILCQCTFFQLGAQEPKNSQVDTYFMPSKLSCSTPSMYIQYVDLVLGIYMIYPSLHCECQLHYRASSRASYHWKGKYI